MAEPTVSNLLLYDDGCPMCTFQMRVLTWLDWFNVVTMMPLSHERARQVAPQLSREDLLAAIHCVTKKGKVLRGARALRFVGMRMPLLVPLALLLWVPGVIWVAEKVYDFVARRRYVLSRMFGCKQACAIMPKRQRENEEALTEPSQSQSPAGTTSPESSSQPH